MRETNDIQWRLNTTKALTDNGLDTYVSTFIQQRIRIQDFPSLTDDELQTMNFTIGDLHLFRRLFPAVKESYNVPYGSDVEDHLEHIQRLLKSYVLRILFKCLRDNHAYKLIGLDRNEWRFE